MAADSGGMELGGAADLERELADARARERAVAEVLDLMRRGPSDLQGILEAVLDRAARLCDAERASIHLREGSAYRTAAFWGPRNLAYERMAYETPRYPGRDTLIGRVVLDGAPVHIADALADPEYKATDLQKLGGYRTMLGVPLLSGEALVGVFVLTRNAVRPFADREIELVRTFADQAVVAVQNAQLFRETRDNLEQQTAVAAVLKAISGSTFDLAAVLKIAVESAANLCRAEVAWLDRYDGGKLTGIQGATYGLEAYDEQPRAPDRYFLIGRVILDRATVNVPDISAETVMRTSYHAVRFGIRSVLGVPLLRDGEPIGGLGLARTRYEPFTDREVDLVKTFADQAVIAIENARLFNETRESLERQTATGEVLRAIAGSPTDVKPVLDAIATNAARFCGAEDASVVLVQGDELMPAAHAGPLPTRPGQTLRLERSAATGRAVIDRRTVHIPDLLADEAAEFTQARERSKETGQRALLAAPLVREGKAIGAILLRKSIPNGFTAKQIELVETFANQAVIAIENVRLFNETRESLERQTATGEVLRAISGSPTDLQPVLDAIASNAARFCKAKDVSVALAEGDRLHLRAHFGPIREPIEDWPIDGDTASGRSVLEVRTISVDDLQTTDAVYPVSARLAREAGHRAFVTAPLVREGRAIGCIYLRRSENRPFTSSEIDLVQTFAAQAVIAIENVRLFNETTESLEQQTAIANILRVISASPTDTEPVLDAIATSATRFAAAEDAAVLLVRGNELVPVAHHGPIPMPQGVPMDRGSVSGRATLEARTIQAADVTAGDEFPRSKQAGLSDGQRTVLAAPLMRGGAAVGVVVMRKIEPRPFTERQVELAQAFADQAAIALENVRLFNETKEGLEQQTATSEILRVIASSLRDVQPVLDAIAENAARVCGASDAHVYAVDGKVLRQRAHFGPIPGLEPGETIPLNRESVIGRTILDGRPIHIRDAAIDLDPSDFPVSVQLQKRWGYRTAMSVPLMRQGVAIGGIAIRRLQVQPFTEKEIALLQTFADQAVIAIENVRLFNETKEALEQQTAVAEVLKTISRSAFDLQPVIDIVLENALRLADADIGWVAQVEGDRFRVIAFSNGFPQAVKDELARATGPGSEGWPRIGEGRSLMSMVLQSRAMLNVDDARADPATKESLVVRTSDSRTVLGLPMLREGVAVGGVILARREVRPFSEREIELVQTFADQAAIAIENVRLFTEIQEKSAELEAANRHKSEFLANMSHELRTPLNAVIGFSEVLLERMFGEVNERQEEYLRDILASGRHLLSLINDILDLAKIEAGRMELERTEFSLREALENGVTMVRERAARHGVALELDIGRDLETVAGDERKVKQVVYNLLSNAVKFTPDGGRIKVSAERANGAVQVTVQDTGIGIAPDDQERIFEEFSQVGRDPERSREGTGLGLTLSRRYVQLHGGRLWVESRPGEGSAFSFTLPQP